MAETTISWTDYTFNPWRGCTKISPGCTNCYAEAMSKRNPKVLGEWGPNGTRVVASESMWRQPIKWNAEAGADDGDLPRRRVFCASLADVFEDRPELEAPRLRLFQLINATPCLDWLLLTKRPENIEAMFKAMRTAGLVSSAFFPWSNIWLGVSVEDQQRADERIPLLLQTPAAVRFLSVEPILGPVDLDTIVLKPSDAPELGKPDVSFSCLRGWYGGVDAGRTRVDWVIVGGESGSNRRNCEIEWIADIAEQCKAAGVALHVKQDSAARPGQQGRIPLELFQRKEFPQ